MRLTLPHYYAFGDEAPQGSLTNDAAWDHLRTQTMGPFAIAGNRTELAQMVATHSEIASRAQAISALVEGSLASYGVGGGLLEASLDIPDLTLTESAPATVERLRLLFPGAKVVRHDLSADGPLEADVHLFHRIDTEFSNRSWRRIFRAFEDQRIVFVPGGMQDPRLMVLELASALLRRHHTRAGLLRSRAAIEALWRHTHESQPVRLGDTDAWTLRPQG